MIPGSGINYSNSYVLHTDTPRFQNTGKIYKLSLEVKRAEQDNILIKLNPRIT